MKVKYFPDTDTAHIEFTNLPVEETREVSEHIYIDIDKEGNLVSMTVEHAKANASLQEFAYEEMSAESI